MTSPRSGFSSRREFIKTITLAGGAAAVGLSSWTFAQSTMPAAATNLAAHTHDWEWLIGNWNVWHRRLKERLAGDTHWEEFTGKSAFWPSMGGLGNIDDNIVNLPAGAYRGLSLRAFNPDTGKWAIWWLDERDPTHIEPPVMGSFNGDSATFMGHDTFKGRPITVRFRWQDVHGARPWWEQAFSTDDGVTWEVNWRNYFTRTAATPTPMPTLADAPRDFAFLVGNWNVKHRRLRHRLSGSHEWDNFDGTLRNWPVLGGHGNVGDNVMHFPAGTVRGVGLRAFDTASKQWFSYWLDSRTPTAIDAPMRGSFANGIATLSGDDTLDGRPIKTRVVWSQITAHSAHWEQFCSADAGATWELNWVSDFTRTA